MNRAKRLIKILAETLVLTSFIAACSISPGTRPDDSFVLEVYRFSPNESIDSTANCETSPLDKIRVDSEKIHVTVDPELLQFSLEEVDSNSTDSSYH